MGDYELELTAPGGTPVIERGTLYDLAVRVWEAPPGLALRDCAAA